MNDLEIIYATLKNLEDIAGIKGQLEASGKELKSNILSLFIDNQEIKFNLVIKKEWRNHHLTNLLNLKNNRKMPIMVIGLHLFPKIKQELRQQNIAYIEANGNVFFRGFGTLIWIDTNKPIVIKDKNSSRAFAKTGLRLVFQFFLDKTYLKKTYRQISDELNIGIGTITNIHKSLVDEGFLLTLQKKEYKFNNMKGLFEKWIESFEMKLKPELKVGTFRFLNKEDYQNWKEFPFNNKKNWWSGEPAGQIMTNYLQATELTLYTIETRAELIKQYKMIPDDNGYIKVYKKFWKSEDDNDSLVPPCLVYADLMNIGDSRCVETAQKIYDEFLQDQF